MITGAFVKSGAREALIAQIETTTRITAPAICSANGYEPEHLEALAAETGLAPAFVMLVRGLAGHSSTFARHIVGELPAGSQTHAAPLEWLKALWLRIGAPLQKAELEAAADQLFKLLEAATQGQAVEPKRWRAVRSAFAAIADGEANAIGEIFAAAAWDPRKAPASFNDAATSFELWVYAQARKEIGWTDEHNEQYRDYNIAMRTFAAEQAGPRAGDGKEWLKTPEGKVWNDRLDAAIAQYQKDHPNLLPDFRTAQREKWAVELRIAQSTLLTLIGLPPEQCTHPVRPALSGE